MDLSMPVMDGIEAAKKIREFDRDVKIIMLTSNDNDEHIFASFAAGANGYCLKETSPERLMHALETVRDGDLWIDSNIASKVLRNVSTTRTTGETANIAQPGDPSALSKEELDVLHSIVEGLGLSEIAVKVGNRNNRSSVSSIPLWKDSRQVTEPNRRCALFVQARAARYQGGHVLPGMRARVRRRLSRLPV